MPILSSSKSVTPVGSALNRYARFASGGMVTLVRSRSTAETMASTASCSATTGNSQGNLLLTPSNMPVPTKNGATSVVCTPGADERNSCRSARWKPTAACLLAVYATASARARNRRPTQQ